MFEHSYIYFNILEYFLAILDSFQYRNKLKLFQHTFCNFHEY